MKLVILSRRARRVEWAVARATASTPAGQVASSGSNWPVTELWVLGESLCRGPACELAVTRKLAGLRRLRAFPIWPRTFAGGRCGSPVRTYFDNL
jgi:hypothetical protein